MLRRALLLPVLAGLVRSQDIPIDDLVDVEIPTYTSTPGLTAAISTYATATAVAAASADQTATPLSVFVSPSDGSKNENGD